MTTYAEDGIHWSSHDLRTRNAMWMYAIGGRGVGKTYEAKRGNLKKYLKRGRQFIYMRRWETEFEDKADFLNDVAHLFPSHEFKVEGMRCYCRKLGKKRPWSLFCYLVALSKTLGKKSVPYPDVDEIVFDEFIIDRGPQRYIQNEVKYFLEFYNTVDRFQDRVKCLFLANAISVVNPYFVYFGIKPRKGVRFTTAMDGYHCCEMIESEAYVERVTRTRFGQMIANTDYFDYAVGNTFVADDSRFIASKPKTAVFQFAVVFDGTVLAFWEDFEDGPRYYVTPKIPKGRSAYILTKSDQAPDMMMVERSSPLLQGVKKMYMLGSVYFQNAVIMASFLNVMTYLNVR